jgi:hypothetical protein
MPQKVANNMQSCTFHRTICAIKQRNTPSILSKVIVLVAMPVAAPVCTAKVQQSSSSAKQPEAHQHVV